jgi:hypothetical protein
VQEYFPAGLNNFNYSEVKMAGHFLLSPGAHLPGRQRYGRAAN